MKKYLKPVYIFLALLIIGGFIFRLTGISTNHSFWSDEAFVAVLARDLITGSKTLTDVFELYNYQRLHILITALSFLIFGMTEFAARLPSVIMSTIGIMIAFLLAKRLSNDEGGIITAFVYAFAQVNLSYATQAKTYAGLETLFLGVLYLLTFIQEDHKWIHVGIICLSTIATLLHFLGILIWIPYGILLINKKTQQKRHIYTNFIILISIITVFFLLFNGKTIIGSFFIDGPLLFSSNNTTLFRELFWRNYAFITLPAIIGSLIIIHKRPRWAGAVGIMIIIYVYLWNFKLHSPNIRYVLPLFGILFTLFGVFWGKVIDAFFPKIRIPIMVCLIVLLYAGGYKIVRKPSVYYSPNADLFADVQNADYKTFYEQVRQQYPDLSNTAIFNNWGDTQYWHLPGQSPHAYFRKGDYDRHPQPSTVDGVMVYGSLEQFLIEKEKYDKGLLVVEDWQSLLPDDIKTYAKENLKREIRVEHLNVSPTDKWPLELYSWGFEEKGEAVR